MSAWIGVTQEELSSRGRCAGARIEQHNFGFTFAEGAVDERQVADDRGEKSEAKARFNHNQKAGKSRARHHVAEAESEKRGAAEIQVGVETGGHSRNVHC